MRAGAATPAASLTMAMTFADDCLPVVVIGGGLAGLVAAAHLAEKGITPTLLDADQTWLGGRLAGGDTVRLLHQGQEWQFADEHGVHAIWGGYVNLCATIERFADFALQPSYGEEWINRWGREVRRLEAGNAIRSRWIPAPFHYLQLLFSPTIWANISPWDFLSLPGVLTSILLTVGVDPLREGKAWDGLMLKDYFIGWTPNLKATFKGLAVNLLAAPAEDISLAGFIAALRFYTILRRDSWQMSYYPNSAGKSIIQALHDTIVRHHGRILPGMTATDLIPDGDGWRIRMSDAAGVIRQVRTRQVILAMHPSGAQRLLLASAATQTQAASIIFPRSTASAVVRMWFSVSPPEGVQGGMLTGDFAPDNYFWLHRLYPDYQAWHDATGGSALEVHFYPNANHANLPDANLLVLATADAYLAFPQVRGTFIHGTVRRNSKVHTVFRVPTDASLHVQTPWAGISACGDWIGWDTPSLWMERATTTGIAAANRVLIANALAPYDILQPPPPEWLVRQLQRLIGGGRWVFRALFRRRK